MYDFDLMNKNHYDFTRRMSREIIKIRNSQSRLQLKKMLKNLDSEWFELAKMIAIKGKHTPQFQSKINNAHEKYKESLDCIAEMVLVGILTDNY